MISKPCSSILYPQGTDTAQTDSWLVNWDQLTQLDPSSFQLYPFPNSHPEPWTCCNHIHAFGLLKTPSTQPRCPVITNFNPVNSPISTFEISVHLASSRVVKKHSTPFTVVSMICNYQVFHLGALLYCGVELLGEAGMLLCNRQLRLIRALESCNWI